MRGLSPFGFIGVVALTFAVPVLAQRAPAIPGHTGTIATPTTVDEEYKLANKIVVATEDGVQHVFPAGTGTFRDLKVGQPVAIYYEQKSTEARVQKVSHSKKTIEVRYDTGATEKLELVNKSAKPQKAGEVLQAPTPAGEKVVTYFSDVAHDRIAYYFRTSKS